MTSSSRIPSLGPRGEGWVAGQFLLLALVAGFGVRGLTALPPGDAPEWLRVGSGSAALVAGILVGVRGARDLGTNLTPFPRPPRDAQLVDSGIYGHIRHPLYAALILVSGGWSLAMGSAGSAVATGALAGWLDLKARREERWLNERFEGYASYRKRTRRFVPKLY
jgi:protein-S-isoprenylcysteine O-methyltransferase Ste14